MKRLLQDTQGIALAVVIFVVTVLLTLTGAGLLFSGLDLKATSALKTGTIAFQVADTGVQHALAVIPAGLTFPYTDPPYTSAAPATAVPNTNHPTMSGFSYSVTAINTAGDTQAILTSTALGPNGSKKVIVAYIGRGSFGLGATSLPGSTASNTETNFSGTSFSINGNDNCNAAPAVPGIVVTDSALATEITNNTTSDGGLASDQMSLVTGAGGSPSVATIQPLSQTVSQIADAYLALPHTDLSDSNYAGNDNWGSSSSPRITRVTGDAQIQGNIEGYGVLIVNGALTVQGNFTFHGLVIALGKVQVKFSGDAGVYGSLLIGESTSPDAGNELDVQGNAHIRYDSCALSPANGWVPLPAAPRLLAWQEKFTN